MRTTPEVTAHPIPMLFGWDKRRIRGGQINLNEIATKTFVHHYDSPNPLLDPQFCTAWVEHIHRNKNWEYSWGGYMEHRGVLWRHSYLERDKFNHLGVDVNYRVGAFVYCPVEFSVLDMHTDLDQDGGWGGRMLVTTRKDELVIFAHLNLANLEYGKWYREMTIVGRIAPIESNGGWFPHLHIQGLRDVSLMENIDGYAKDGDHLETDYPNPLPILGLRET